METHATPRCPECAKEAAAARLAIPRCEGNYDLLANKGEEDKKNTISPAQYADRIICELLDYARERSAWPAYLTIPSADITDFDFTLMVEEVKKRVWADVSVVQLSDLESLIMVQPKKFTLPIVISEFSQTLDEFRKYGHGCLLHDVGEFRIDCIDIARSFSGEMYFQLIKDVAFLYWNRCE